VIDTCVFPRKKWLDPIVDGARDGVVVPVWSPLIIAEVNRLLTWRWLKRAGGDQSDASWKSCSAASKTWFSIVTRAFRVVDDHPPYEQAWSDQPRDIWDIPIWTAAIRAQLKFPGAPVFIVTENLKDGPPKDKNGLQYHRNVGFIHPDNFLSLLSAWADFMHTGEPRMRHRRSPVRQPSEGAPRLEQEEITLFPEIAEVLRIASAGLNKNPDDP